MTTPGDVDARFFAVLPAAGRSVRMGSPKLLLPWRGATLIEHVLATWRASRAQRIVVCLHPHDVRLAELCRACGVDVAVVDPPPPDMKASISAGLRYLEAAVRPRPTDAWLTAPADLPRLSTTTINRLIEAYDPRCPVAWRPRHAGRFGHPVLWPWSAAAAVGRLPDDRGLDALFESQPFDVVECDADCTSADVDTPDDYRRLQP